MHVLCTARSYFMQMSKYLSGEMINTTDDFPDLYNVPTIGLCASTEAAIRRMAVAVRLPLQPAILSYIAPSSSSKI